MIPEVHTPIRYRDIINAYKLSITENGSILQSFEEDFARYVGVSYARCVSSGRNALYLILKSLGLRSGDEVIVPAYTSPIIPMVLLSLGFRPVYGNVDVDSLNIKTESLPQLINNKTRAIISVHMFGNPCKNKEIKDIASENDIVVIEDVAQALGAKYLGEKVGKFGDVALFSFGLGKNITTMEGGMIVTNREDLFKKLETLIPHASVPFIKTYTMMIKTLLYPAATSSGTYDICYRIWNLVRDRYTFSEERVLQEFSPYQAALGRLLLRRIDVLNKKRIENAEKIIEGVQGIERLGFQKSEKHGQPVYLRLVVKHKKGKIARDRLRTVFLKYGFDAPTLNGYYLRPYLDFCEYPKKVHEMFADIKTNIVEKTLALPTNPSLSNRDVNLLVSILRNH